MVKDGGAVLGATITTLAILGGGVVHFIEKFEEGGVGEGGGVVGYLEGFGVCVALGISSCRTQNVDTQPCEEKY